MLQYGSNKWWNWLDVTHFLSLSYMRHFADFRFIEYNSENKFIFKNHFCNQLVSSDLSPPHHHRDYCWPTNDHQYIHCSVLSYPFFIMVWRVTCAELFIFFNLLKILISEVYLWKGNWWLSLGSHHGISSFPTDISASLGSASNSIKLFSASNPVAQI